MTDICDFEEGGADILPVFESTGCQKSYLTGATKTSGLRTPK